MRKATNPVTHKQMRWRQIQMRYVIKQNLDEKLKKQPATFPSDEDRIKHLMEAKLPFNISHFIRSFKKQVCRLPSPVFRPH